MTAIAFGGFGGVREGNLVGSMACSLGFSGSWPMPEVMRHDHRAMTSGGWWGSQSPG